MNARLVVSIVLGLALLVGGYAIGKSWLSGAGFGIILVQSFEAIRKSK